MLLGMGGIDTVVMSDEMADQLRDLADLLDNGYVKLESFDIDVKDDIVLLSDGVDKKVHGFDLEMSLVNTPKKRDESGGE